MLGFFALLFGGSYIAGDAIKGKMHDSYYKSKEEYHRKRYDEINTKYGLTSEDAERMVKYLTDYGNYKKILKTFDSDIRFIVGENINKLYFDPGYHKDHGKWAKNLLLAKEGKIDTYFWAYEGAYNSLNHVIVDSSKHRFLLLMNKKYIEIDPDLELIEKKNRKLCPDGKHYELGDIEPKYLIPEYELKNYTKLS